MKAGLEYGTEEICRDMFDQSFVSLSGHVDRFSGFSTRNTSPEFSPAEVCCQFETALVKGLQAPHFWLRYAASHRSLSPRAKPRQEQQPSVCCNCQSLLPGSFSVAAGVFWLPPCVVWPRDGQVVDQPSGDLELMASRGRVFSQEGASTSRREPVAPLQIPPFLVKTWGPQLQHFLGLTGLQDTEKLSPLILSADMIWSMTPQQTVMLPGPQLATGDV